MTDHKRGPRERQIDPLENVLQRRTPPEAQLGPYPSDDLVATPAPRPSLTGIAAELEAESSGWRLRALADRKGAVDARLTEYRWLLEELRVSFFAQELRTPQPVSVKRLDKAWEQLTR